MKKFLLGCLVIGSLCYIPVSAVIVNMPEEPTNVPPRQDYSVKPHKDKVEKSDDVISVKTAEPETKKEEKKSDTLSVMDNYKSDAGIDMAKDAIYNFILGEVFSEMQTQLVSQGYTQQSVSSAISTMKSRVDLKEMQNETWGCVSQYTQDEMMQSKKQFVKECFGDYAMKLKSKNQDLLSTLKK